MFSGSGSKREGFLSQNVNVLLGGSMLFGLVLLLCLMCFCCRYTATRKPPSDSSSSYWLQDTAVASPDDEELSCDREIERIYTVDVRPTGNPQPWPSPPPAYSAVHEVCASIEATNTGSTPSLPTYEAAMQLQSLHL